MRKMYWADIVPLGYFPTAGWRGLLGNYGARLASIILLGPPIVLNEDGTHETLWDIHASRLRMLELINKQISERESLPQRGIE